MRGKNRLFWAKGAVILGAIPLLIYAYEYGPDAGYADVPGELGNCTASGCHTGRANSFSGSVAVMFPDGLNYTPGVKQHLVVTITDPGQRRWGFELTARTDPKTMAGSFTPSDGNTQVICASANLVSQAVGNPGCPGNMSLAYVEHSLNGYNRVQSNPGSYEFDWTPPASDAGPITIYVAANAANGDLTSNGDHIYTKTYTLAPATGGGGKPQITSVANGASFQPGYSPGSWISIKGSDLASTSRTWTTSEIVNGKLPTKLDDVSVTINGTPAAVYFISPGQINVLAPADNAQGPVNVQVSNGGGTSDPATIQLQSFSPAFFQWDTYAVATRADFSLVGKPGLIAGATFVPAKPGDVIILWGTGFGTTDPAVPAGQLVPPDQAPKLSNTPTVTIGGVAAPYLGGALSPGFAGLYQIAVQVPDSVPSGDQKVQVQIGGVLSPDGVLLTVQ